MNPLVLYLPDNPANELNCRIRSNELDNILRRKGVKRNPAWSESLDDPLRAMASRISPNASRERLGYAIGAARWVLVEHYRQNPQWDGTLSEAEREVIQAAMVESLRSRP